jgi:hypothetical protein
MYALQKMILNFGAKTSDEICSLAEDSKVLDGYFFFFANYCRNAFLFSSHLHKINEKKRIHIYCGFLFNFKEIGGKVNFEI